MPVGEYLAKRQALIAQDRAQRLDARPAHALGEDEAKADGLVRVVRAREALTVWGPDSNSDIDDDTHLFPGMAFLTGESFSIIIDSRKRTDDLCPLPVSTGYHYANAVVQDHE